MRADVRLAKAIIAALTAERDRLREERDKALRAHAAALIESRIWERRTERAEAERDTLAAQLARAETVVEAAQAWLTHRRSADAFLREPRAELIALADALDAYQAPPATTEREGAGDDPA